MRISKIEVFRFPAPFKTVFRHASASRRSAENLIVAAHSECGRTGYGEGCPRSYVTGETAEGAAAFVKQHRASAAAGVSDEHTLRAWIDANGQEINKNPAAFCALELALLDLIGRVTDRTVESVLSLPPLDGAFCYSAVIGDSPYPVFWWQFNRYRRNGFSDFKLKVSGDPARDGRKLRLVRRGAAGTPRIRLDANNLWTDADAAARHISGLGIGIFAVEEPLRAGDIDGFRKTGEACGVKIILDESALKLQDLESLTDAGRWIINVRVSKMGGLIRSLQVAQTAVQRGLGVIVGAQVGETSVLTRAGLTVMHAVKPDLTAAEGAFGTYLLKEDLAAPVLMFAAEGRLDVSGQAFTKAPGLGLQVKAELLAEHKL
ncbi:MAG: mandelate racemase/muconate lactonizing enzyme family protein [Rhodospirillales bacterium]